MARNISLPSFQYQVVTWWKKHTEGKLPKGNTLKHLAQQNLMIANRLIAYSEQSDENRSINDIRDELALMLQNVAILAHCVDIPINDIFESALPEEDENK